MVLLEDKKRKYFSCGFSLLFLFYFISELQLCESADGLGKLESALGEGTCGQHTGGAGSREDMWSPACSQHSPFLGVQPGGSP